jgi:hypothetical protein
MGRALMPTIGLTEREKEACEFFRALVSKVGIVKYVILKKIIREKREYLEVHTLVEDFCEEVNKIYGVESRLLDEFKDLRFSFSVEFLAGNSPEQTISYEKDELIYSK